MQNSQNQNKLKCKTARTKLKCKTARNNKLKAQNSQNKTQEKQIWTGASCSFSFFLWSWFGAKFCAAIFFYQKNILQENNSLIYKNNFISCLLYVCTLFRRQSNKKKKPNVFISFSLVDQQTCLTHNECPGHKNKINSASKIKKKKQKKLQGRWSAA